MRYCARPRTKAASPSSTPPAAKNSSQNSSPTPRPEIYRRAIALETYMHRSWIRSPTRRYKEARRHAAGVGADGRRGFCADTSHTYGVWGRAEPASFVAAAPPHERCAGCARGIEYVGRWTEAYAPLETRVQLVTPNVRTQPTPAIPQPRGVEDAAPYGASAKRMYPHRGKHMRKRRKPPPTSRLP